VAEHNVGHELMVMGNGTVPRPEEDRLTLAEKSERLNQQLKVRPRIHKKKNVTLFMFSFACSFFLSITFVSK